MILSDELTKQTVIVCGAVNSGAVRLVADSLNAAGVQARTHCLVEEGNYRSSGSGGNVSRWLLRLRIQAEYPLRLFWAACRAKRDDVFIVTTNPFFALFAVKAGSLFSRARSIWLVHDLYPEALEASGHLRSGGFAASLFGRLTRFGFRTPNGVVFLGDVLKQTAVQRWGSPKIATVIPPISAEDSACQQTAPLPVERELRVLYSGHLGHLHAAETLIACIRAARQELPESVRFRFQVSGPFAALLKKELAKEDIAVESTTGSADEHRSSLANCHLSLVSISPRGALAAFPSKTFSAIAIGRPVLAICPRWSDVRTLLTQHDAGWVVSNSDEMREELAANEVANRFVEVLRQIAATPNLLAGRSAQARRAFEEVGSQERMSKAWKDIVERVRG